MRLGPDIHAAATQRGPQIFIGGRGTAALAGVDLVNANTFTRRAVEIR